MLFVAYPIFCFALIGVFVRIADVRNDPEWVMRGGTVLTAVSALFIIYEAFFERSVRLSDDEAPTEPTSVADVSPVVQIAQRIEHLRGQARVHRSENQRLRLVILNSFMVVIGELIQGFGDLLYVAALGK